MIKYLSKTNLNKIKGSICLLRVDFNIEPQHKDSSLRIKSILPTIRLLQKHKVKIIFVSHRERPPTLPSKSTGPKSIFGPNDLKKYSLKPFVKILESNLKNPVTFIPHFNFPKIKEQIRSQQNLFLLENIRLLRGETKNSKELAENLSFLADFYVNDAFANTHRKHASIVAITKHLPSYAGLLLEKEIKHLTHATGQHDKPLTIIFGGAKVKSKTGVIEYFKRKANYILLGGVVANTFLAAKGTDIGKSLHDKKIDVQPFLKLKNVVLPEDWATENEKILDIGPKTTKTYTNIITKSKTIIWNGPMGLIERKKFAKGSLAVAKAIGKKKRTAFTLAGGGETTGMITNLKLENTFDLISTGGGAMLEFLSGKKLPGIEALKS